jgi:alpha-glucosidase
MRKLILQFCLLFIVHYCQGKSQIALYSPNRQLKSVIYIGKDHGLQYKVYYKNQLIIEPSDLGFTISGRSFGNSVSSVKLNQEHCIIQKYELLGKHRFGQSEAKEAEILVTEGDVTYSVIVRLINDCFAFRYQLPFTAPYLINGERSSFKLTPKARIWYFERNNDWKLKSYAGEWRHADISQMATISSEGPVQGKPLIAELSGDRYLAITEAALYNYSGMRLKAMNERKFVADFTEGNKGFQTSAKLSPWRVILVCKGLNNLVNTDAITSLNPPPDRVLFKNQAYIKSGRSVWSWMTRDTNYMKPRHEERYIDYAANLNFEYVLIDEGWEKQWPDKWKQLKEISDYGKTKHVGIWVWENSAGIRDSVVRCRFLDSVKKAGAVGVKVDFMNSEEKQLIDFDIDLLKECAERQLMVNLHGCQSPSGESRTYPNEMTREGIRGMELNGMAEGPITAAHNAALPFTRFIAGHGDYTPGLFSKPGNTTWGQQLACLFMFDSPLLCLAENPEVILTNPNLKQIIPLLRTMPTVWDQTVVLPCSKIGELAALAKRRDKVWYVSVLNGEARQKQIEIKLGFLTGHGTFLAEIVNDEVGKTASLTTHKLKVIGGSSMKNITVEPNGGVVIRITRLQSPEH